jgi:hypothetical protein
VGAASPTEAAAVRAPPAAVTVPPPAEEANVAEAAIQVRYNIEHDL